MSFAKGSCATEAELEKAFGEQVRTKAFFIDTRAFGDRPLCSGLTVAQQIQKMRDQAFPDEVKQRTEQAEAVRNAEAEQAARAAAEQAAREAAQSAQAAATDGAAGGPGRKPIDPGKPLVLTTAALGMTLNELLDKLVQTDSKSWMMNRYVKGSMHDAKYLSGNKAKTTYVARGNYTFTGFGGGAGWVKVTVKNGDLDCLEYWDQPGNCRQMFQSLSQQAVAGAAMGMMTDGGGSGGSSRSDRDDYDPDEERRRRGANDAPPPPPPAPVTPIGGSGGLYGCASPPCW